MAMGSPVKPFMKDKFGRPVVPCKYCGTVTAMLGTGLCDRCWTVGTGLPEFLKSAEARAFVVKLLSEIETEVRR